MITLLILIVLVLLIVGALPVWPYTRPRGYAPLGGVLITVVLILVLLRLLAFI
jgi:hypothetical protein